MCNLIGHTEKHGLRVLEYRLKRTVRLLAAHNFEDAYDTLVSCVRNANSVLDYGQDQRVKHFVSRHIGELSRLSRKLGRFNQEYRNANRK